MCHYSNLGFDLATLLYSSIKPSVREENLDRFLAVYTKSLVLTCKNHSYKGPLPTVKDVQECLKMLHIMTSNMRFLMLPFFVQSSREDAQDRALEYVKCYSEETSSEAKTPNLINYNDENIIKILKQEIQNCIEENIF